MSKTLPKLIIIDGNALIHRSFHALPLTMQNKDGLKTNAVYGFTTFLLKAIEEFKPDYAILTLDRKAPTFRHIEYKEYKATRTKAPDELYDQIPLVREVAETFGLPIFELDGFEADDLIGTICQKVNKKIEKIIITGDMDTLQLVNDHTKVYTMSRGLSDSVIYGPEQVLARYNFPPEGLIDYKGLRGDSSDNIPGVKGIGEKTGMDLVSKYKNLENIYEALDNDILPVTPRIKELLLVGRESAFMSRSLATINLEAPIEINLEKAAFKINDREKIMQLFSKLDFRSLINRIPQASFAAQNLPNKIKRHEDNNDYSLVSSDEDIKKMLEALADKEIITIDTEIDSLDPINSKLLGVSLCAKPGQAFFIEAKYLKDIKDIIENASIKKCGHNIKFDYRVLKNQGVKMKGLYFDSMLASYILNPESRQHSLDALSFSELGIEKIKRQDLLQGEKSDKGYENIAPEILAIYACEDADCTFQLQEKLNKRINTENLSKLFFDIEMPLVSILGDMEDIGIEVDPKFLGTMEKELQKSLDDIEKNITKLAGESFNINSPKQLKIILFEKLQIDPKGIKKTKTGLSTAADELEKMKELHPIIPFIIEQRELNKLLSTYIKALPELINKKTGRVHTSFNQAITATGRLSSSEPNLQNIPAKSAIGQKIRQAFVAPKNKVLLAIDYSQIELRLLAAFSKDLKMTKAFKNNEDIHRLTAAEIRGIPESEVTKDMRREAKAINFGIIYGQGPRGLSQSAGIPYNQAKDFIAKYFEVYSGAKKYLDGLITKAKKMEYVETAFGRKRRLPDINSSAIMLAKAAERMAVNMPFQGSAADILKIAMNKVYKEIEDVAEIKLLLQVHDELIFEVDKKEIDIWAKKIKKIMEAAVDLNIKLIAEASSGNNWGKMKKIKAT